MGIWEGVSLPGDSVGRLTYHCLVVWPIGSVDLSGSYDLACGASGLENRASDLRRPVDPRNGALDLACQGVWPRLSGV